MLQTPVQSPCVSICVLNEDEICTGCYRSSDEICRWALMSNEEKREVYANIAKRVPKDESEAF